MADTTARGREGTPAGAGHCSHCRCDLGIAHPGGKNKCVFKGLDSAKARAAGKKFATQLRADPSLDKEQLITDLKEEFA
jgi:hypothetical protein